jgi:pyruvate dehydrogenase E1 component alpha subunit
MESITLEDKNVESDLCQIVSIDGTCDKDKIADLSTEQIIGMYRLLNLTRIWNDKGKSLQRQGRLSTLPSLKGQEAAGVGIAYAMHENDWLSPAFREAGALFHLGVSPVDQFLFWGGDERGARIAENHKLTNISIIVGGHLPHAVGIAYAAKYKKENSAVICVLGDGATSEGDFHESLNFASVLQVPVVFVIQNNGWAISTPQNRQTATATYAEKSAAYAMDGLRVDGNDVFAVYRTIKDYADRARKENKPALIELVTYRLDDHTTADDATRYRTDEEVEEWKERDPIARLRRYLEKYADWNETREQEIIDSCTAKVEAATKEYLNIDPPDPRSMFTHMYNEMPWHLREQQSDVDYWLKAGEDD